MDLNIENYSIEEIFNILHIDVKSLENADLSQEFLYTKLQNKIAKLQNSENSEISENKAQLVDFFINALLK